MEGYKSTVEGYLEGDPSIRLAQDIVIENFYGFTHKQLVDKLIQAKRGKVSHRTFLGAVLIEKVMTAYKENETEAFNRIINDIDSVKPVIWGWGQLKK